MKTLNDLTRAQLTERSGGEHIPQQPFGYIGRFEIKDVFVDFQMTSGSSVGRVMVTSIEADDGSIISWIAYEAEDGPQVGTFKPDKVFLTELDALIDRGAKLSDRIGLAFAALDAVSARVNELR